MKYKIGDKVRVRDDLEKDIFYGEHRFEEEQEEFKGKSAIINNVNKASNYYDLDIDYEEFYWTDEMLEPVAENNANSDENTDEVSTNSVESKQFTKEDFKFGDIVTVRNGYKYIYVPQKNKLFNSDGTGFLCLNDINNLLESKGANSLDIMKVERYTDEYKTTGIDCKLMKLEKLYERKKEILDEKEKEYLSKFIEPFRDRIEYIVKRNAYTKEWLYFCFGDLLDEENFGLPCFDEYTMYKGMIEDKEYTLEELGL